MQADAGSGLTGLGVLVLWAWPTGYTENMMHCIAVKCMDARISLGGYTFARERTGKN